jgi:hypothetical protein
MQDNAFGGGASKRLTRHISSPEAQMEEISMVWTALPQSLTPREAPFDKLFNGRFSRKPPRPFALAGLSQRSLELHQPFSVVRHKPKLGTVSLDAAEKLLGQQRERRAQDGRTYQLECGNRGRTKSRGERNSKPYERAPNNSPPG